MKHYLIKYGRHYLLSVDRKTDKHPLVNIFLSDLMKYQEFNLKQVTGGKAD